MKQSSELTIIRPTSGLGQLRLREIWKFRELLFILASRNVSVRYKQAAIGVLWVVLQPVIMTTIFTIIFSRLARFSAGDVPYPLHIISGLVLWQFFSASINGGGASLVDNKAMLTKIYFPRLILPMSMVLGCVIDFTAAFVVVIGLMIWYGIMPGWQVVFAPLFLLLAFIISFGLATMASAINVLYRDVGIALPYFLQVWMYATPIIYPLRVVPESYHWILALNPMTGIIEGFRWSLLAGRADMPSAQMLLLSLATGAIVLACGLIVFLRLERVVIDEI